MRRWGLVALLLGCSGNKPSPAVIVRPPQPGAGQAAVATLPDAASLPSRHAGSNTTDAAPDAIEPSYGDYLESEPTPFETGWRSTAYEAKVSEVLFPGSGPSKHQGFPFPLLQMVIIPSGFGNEQAVYLEPHAYCPSPPDPDIVSVQARKNIHSSWHRNWGSSIHDTGPPTMAGLARLSIPVDVAKVPIDCGTASVLDELWSAMVSTPRPCMPDGKCGNLMPDGISYHFARFGVAAGASHTPKEGTNAYRLAEIGRLLIKYARVPAAEREAVKQDLFAKATALLDDVRRRDAR
jgi:hypothetical protein